MDAVRERTARALGTHILFPEFAHDLLPRSSNTRQHQGKGKNTKEHQGTPGNKKVDEILIAPCAKTHVFTD